MQRFRLYHHNGNIPIRCPACDVIEQNALPLNFDEGAIEEVYHYLHMLIDNQICSRMYHGGETFHNTCVVCVTIERCVAYSGQLSQRRTVIEWDQLFVFCHENSREFLAIFHLLFPFP